MSERFFKRLAQGPIICAEGYVFELERRGYLSAGAYVPEVVLDYPEVVSQLHEEFLRSGSDVAVALTYYANRSKMTVVGREGDLEALNRQALKLAKAAAKPYRALVAGNICNTWTYENGNPKAAREVRKQYREQIAWAKSEGVDFILAETIEYLGEALIALEEIKRADLPAVINLCPIYAETKDGIDWIEAATRLKKAGADIVGFNCARGPETILPLGKRLRKAIEGPISLVPVPYHTTNDCPSFQFLKNRNGESSYTLGLDQHYIDRQEAAEFGRRAKSLGVEFIGLCCGAGPHHIRALAEALGRNPIASRYSPDMDKHGLLGSAVADKEKEFLKLWN